MVKKKWIKIIISDTISKILNKLWYSNKNLCDFILEYWNWKEFIESSKFLKLYKPKENTIAYKWYFTNLDRTLVFHYSKDNKWVVYPIFFWNKKSNLWKNITKILVEKEIENFYKQFNKDLENWNFKIYHL